MEQDMILSDDPLMEKKTYLELELDDAKITMRPWFPWIASEFEMG